MIELALLITFAAMGIKVAIAVSNESEVFNEFNQPKTIGWLALLFPVGPFIYYITAFSLGWIPAILLMAICYVPCLISSKRRIDVFDRAGTDRVNKAKEASFQAYGTSIAGLIYIALILMFNMVSTINA